jgi:hypothetical protein
MTFLTILIKRARGGGVRDAKCARVGTLVLVATGSNVATLLRRRGRYAYDAPPISLSVAGWGAVFLPKCHRSPDRRLLRLGGYAMRRYETDEKCPRPDAAEERRIAGRFSIGIVIGLLVVLALSAWLSEQAEAAIANVYWRVDLHQGSSIIAYGQGSTELAAWDDCFRLQGTTKAMTAAETRRAAVSAVTTTVVRWCQNPRRYANVSPDPVTPTPTPTPTPSPGTISWKPPTTNDDGSTLTDLAWYLVHYGTTPEAQVNTVRVMPSSAPTYQLPRGTWYCSVRAVNSTDRFSIASNTIQVVRL